MKSCGDRKKLIALLVLNALDASAAAKLRGHLDSCARCRQYLAEISRVTRLLATASPDAEPEASGLFHRNLMARLTSEASAPFWEKMLAALRPVHFDWRIAVCLAAAVAGLLTVSLWQGPHAVVGGSPPTPATIPTVEAAGDLTPTLGNYQQAADQSPEKLDDLLSQQERQSTPGTPIYTASARSLSF